MVQERERRDHVVALRLEKHTHTHSNKGSEQYWSSVEEERWVCVKSLVDRGSEVAGRFGFCGQPTLMERCEPILKFCGRRHHQFSSGFPRSPNFSLEYFRARSEEMFWTMKLMIWHHLSPGTTPKLSLLCTADNRSDLRNWACHTCETNERHTWRNFSGVCLLLQTTSKINMQSQKDDEIEHIHTLREAGAGKTSERTCSLGDTTFSLTYHCWLKSNFLKPFSFLLRRRWEGECCKQTCSLDKKQSTNLAGKIGSN